MRETGWKSFISLGAGRVRLEHWLVWRQVWQPVSQPANLISGGPVVQRIGLQFPKLTMQVRFLPGLPIQDLPSVPNDSSQSLRSGVRTVFHVEHFVVAFLYVHVSTY